MAEFPTRVPTFPDRVDKRLATSAIANEPHTLPATAPFTVVLEEGPDLDKAITVTNAAQTVTFTRRAPGYAIEPGEFTVDAYGNLTGHPDNFSTAILVSYHGKGTIARAAHVNRVQDEVKAIANALLTGSSGSNGALYREFHILGSATTHTGWIHRFGFTTADAQAVTLIRAEVVSPAPLQSTARTDSTIIQISPLWDFSDPERILTLIIGEDDNYASAIDEITANIATGESFYLRVSQGGGHEHCTVSARFALAQVLE